MNSNSQLIDLTGSDEEDDDEDLKLAIALSLQEQQHLKTPSPGEHPLPSERGQNSKQDERPQILGNNSTQSLLSLDRKQMEADRFARLKRKRNESVEHRAISPPPIRRSNQNSPQRNNSELPLHARSNVDNKSITPVTSSISFGSLQATASQSRVKFSHGKVLLTSSTTTQPHTISLTELLKPTEPDVPLKSALLSTFIIDFDWLLPHFDTRNVSFVLALHARGDQEKQLIQKDFEGIRNVRLVFPHVGGVVNCMHSKIMLLFYENASKDPKKSRCRIVVTSANLVPWDWGVGGVMENIIFVIDLPPKDQNASTMSQTDIQFRDNLIQMLDAMNTPNDVAKKLDKFDFSEAALYSFIHTIGGGHRLSANTKDNGIEKFFSAAKGELRKSPTTPIVDLAPVRSGMVGLSDAIDAMGFAVSQSEASYPLRLDFVTSSLGNLKLQFLQNLYLATCGQCPATPANLHGKAVSLDKKDTTNATHLKKPELASLINSMSIYFPSDQTVRNSKGGPSSAGTICFQSKWWHGVDNEFPKKMLSDCVGIRQDGILMHSKILYVRFARPKIVSSAESPHHNERHKSTVNQLFDGLSHSRSEAASASRAYAGWVYLGSANLSESAWGQLVTDSRTREPKLNCRNWESGVIIPVPLKVEHEGKDLHGLSLEQVFGDYVPVPMEYPGIKLVETGREPWYFNG